MSPSFRARALVAGLHVGLALALSLVAATASAVPPTRAQVRALLSGYEDTPGEPTWRALGPETLPLLIELYRDRSEPRFVRLRAVAVSRFYPSPATRTFLLAVARAPDQNDLFVREAILGLGVAFGDDVSGDIAPFLDHQRTPVREGAVIALAAIPTDRARALLRARLPLERAAHVRERIVRALGQ